MRPLFLCYIKGVMKMPKLTGADYLLLMLYLDDKKPIKSAVRLTKMMFIFNKEIVPLLKKKGANIQEENLPDFQPYNYGPFSKDVYEQIELFQNINFIEIKNLKAFEEMDEVDDWEETAFIDEIAEPEIEYENRRDGKFMQYKLTEMGAEYVLKEIVPHLTEEQEKILLEYKRRIIQTPIIAILRYVYTKYPEMAQNSLIRNEVL